MSNHLKFDRNGWNSCVVLPPEEAEFTDLLIREKGKPHHEMSSVGGTRRLWTYSLGWYVDGQFKIESRLTDGRVIQDNIKNHPENYEYKIINYN